MTDKKPDYLRILDFLKANAGTYYPTYAIAQACECQDNSCQRAINFNLKDEQHIQRRKIEGSQVKEYAYIAVLPDPDIAKTYGHQEIDNLCSACHKSHWYRGKKCAVCGAETGRGKA
jgi:hypothetical protein